MHRLDFAEQDWNLGDNREEVEEEDAGGEKPALWGEVEDQGIRGRA